MIWGRCPLIFYDLGSMCIDFFVSWGSLRCFLQYQKGLCFLSETMKVNGLQQKIVSVEQRSVKTRFCKIKERPTAYLSPDFMCAPLCRASVEASEKLCNNNNNIQIAQPFFVQIGGSSLAPVTLSHCLAHSGAKSDEQGCRHPLLCSHWWRQ